MGIYDAVNPTSVMRRGWKETLDEHGIQTIFIESLCDNQEIIEQNVRSVKISSPDVPPPLPTLCHQVLMGDSTWAGTQTMQSRITLQE